MSKSKEPRPSATDVTSITRSLAAPFDLTEVKFKPLVVKNNRALALAYVDARAIQDRLDDGLGVEGWQDEYTTLDDCSVACRLRFRLGEHCVTKMDFRSPHEKPDDVAPLKVTLLDGTKTVAVEV